MWTSNLHLASKFMTLQLNAISEHSDDQYPADRQTVPKTALFSAEQMQGGERLIRLPELLRTIGVSRATAYRYMDDGRLPKPIKLSRRCSAWKASAINDWLARLQAA